MMLLSIVSVPGLFADREDMTMDNIKRIEKKMESEDKYKKT